MSHDTYTPELFEPTGDEIRALADTLRDEATAALESGPGITPDPRAAAILAWAAAHLTEIAGAR